MKIRRICASIGVVAVMAAGGLQVSSQLSNALENLPRGDRHAEQGAANAVQPVAVDMVGPAPAGPGEQQLEDLIAGLTVVGKLPSVPGYERSCDKGKSCVFGAAWTDKYDGTKARNGCDTRNDLLGAQLVDVVFKPGTRDCKVLSGTLHDRYTGKDIHFTTENPQSVQVDHIFALSRAWRAGASTWPIEQRVNFANDTDVNLLTADGKANQSKSDQGPDTWLPSNTVFQCDYATRYLTVAAKYHLTVTTGDVNATRSACATETR